jgi:ABC-type proline/glycine betaine transport system permease subunit
VKRLVDETTTRAEQAIDHAAMRVLVIGIALITAVSLAVLVVRRLSAR